MRQNSCLHNQHINKITKTIITILLTLIINTLSNQSFATTITASSKASAKINSFCTISATNINFGTYTPNNGDVVTQGTFNLLCTKGTSVSIGTERNPGVDTANCPNGNLSFCYANGVRYMNDGKGNALYYNLFQSSTLNSNTVIPGASWFVGNNYITTVATGFTQNIPFWAGLAANQYVPPGTYTDSVIVTVTY